MISTLDRVINIRTVSAKSQYANVRSYKTYLVYLYRLAHMGTVPYFYRGKTVNVIVYLKKLLLQSQMNDRCGRRTKQ